MGSLKRDVKVAVRDPLYILKDQERLVPFLRRVGSDWDFIRGQLLNLSPEDQLFLSSWCQKVAALLKGSLIGLDYEDRLLRLESDKETLHLQVSVLSDQIDVQTDKIKDLERLLDDKKNVLETTEEQLSRELLTRSSLETQKLELLTELSSLRLKQASLERENYELKEKFGQPRASLNDLSVRQGSLNYRAGSPSNPLIQDGQRLRLTSASSFNSTTHGQNGGEPQRTRTPPATAYRRVDPSAFGTVPRRSPGHPAFQPLSLSPEKASLSSGNIRDLSSISNDHAQWNAKLSLPLSTEPPKPPQKRGILRLFDKLRRSNSGSLEAPEPPTNSHQIAPLDFPPYTAHPNNPNFVRGGVRATAAPRLGWGLSQGQVKGHGQGQNGGLPKTLTLSFKPEGPVTSWTSSTVISWLCSIGLEMYSEEIKRWVKSGQQLLDASASELEKELSLKHPLHRKKLLLAIQALKSPSTDPGGKLDYHWVTRWLDDVGLPQYKEAFAEGRVDGRVLNLLSQEDLLFLKVSSTLHHASIRRGIQILRIHSFSPDCLVRRSSSELSSPSFSVSEKERILQVASWTNHRVMEWLRAIDLAEYAPNLRGSGVHGALIIFEPRFNAELIATLLSIPGNKTLLRRHLCLQVNDLVGPAIMGEKRGLETSQDFVPLNPTTKVKVIKRSQFPLRRKRDFQNEELLCPLDLPLFPYKADSLGQLSSSQDSGNSSSSEIPSPSSTTTTKPAENQEGGGKEKVSNI